MAKKIVAAVVCASCISCATLFGASARQPWTSFDPRGQWSATAQEALPKKFDATPKRFDVKVTQDSTAKQFFHLQRSDDNGTWVALVDGDAIYAVSGEAPVIYLLSLMSSDMGRVTVASLAKGIAEQMIATADDETEHRVGVLDGSYTVQGADFDGRSVLGTMHLHLLDGDGHDAGRATMNAGVFRFDRDVRGVKTRGVGLWIGSTLVLAEGAREVSVGKWNHQTVDWQSLPVVAAPDGTERVGPMESESWTRVSPEPPPRAAE